MFQDIKKTSKHAIIYALGNITTKIVGLILIPLYTNPKYLSKADYGTLAILEATLQLLTGILAMAMVNSLSRWYWDKKYESQQKSIFFTTIAFLLMALTPSIGALSFFSGQISMLVFGSNSFKYLLTLSVGTSGIMVINNQILCLVKLQHKSAMYASTQILKFVLMLGLTLIGIILLNGGLKAVWEAMLIAELFLLIILLPYALKNMDYKFDSIILREMLVFGYPLMFASLSSVILAVTDRFMLNSMAGLEDTGVYSLGLKVANTLKIVVTTPIALALSPVRMKKINEKSNHRFYAKIMTYTQLVFIICMIGLSLFSIELLKVFTGSDFYWAANGVIPIISFSLMFGLMKDNAVTGLVIMKRTKVMGLLIFVTSFINIAINYLLIPIFNIYGAAFATFISQFIFLGLILYYSQKSYFIPYEWRKILLLMILSSLNILAGYLITDVNVGIRIIIKLALLFSFPFQLYVFKFYETVELDYIKNIFRLWKKPSAFIENLNRIIKG